ncbi:GmrSD restriction endonuclease domain-containing protein [Chryseobacterium sp. T1]
MILKYNFHQLISTHIIEVPIIQRDYAQGRISDNVKYIRERFVKSLVEHVVTNSQLHLGFVYGKIEGKERKRELKLHQESVSTLLHSVKQYANQFNINVEASINVNELTEPLSLRFIPLDGQQRLTTLFLLYWYISMRKKESSLWLLNFKYNNRKMALAFFETLTNQDNIQLIEKELEADIQKQITEYTWYLDKWKYDATVNGAIVMLQAIHEEFANHSNFDFSLVKLEEIPFKFDFLDLDDLKQSDELYIKMNERGKQLTDFEHFKAWLQDVVEKKNLSDEEQSFLSSFWKKIDTVWLDFFWKKIDADFRSLDDFYFNYLKTTAINFHLAKSKEPNLPRYLKDLLQTIRNVDNYDKQNVTYIPLSQFVLEDKNDKENKKIIFELFSMDCLQHINKTLSTLIAIDEETNSKINTIIKEPFISKGKNILTLYLNNNTFTPNYWDQVYYYFLLELLKSDKINISFWMRTMRNIIYNTYIQNPDNVYDALQSINSLISSEVLDLKEGLMSDMINLSFFNKDQIAEEKYKCNKIENGWDSKEIQGLENHIYFMGQIQFVFQLADENNVLFSQYAELISGLFSEKIEDFELQQALLTKGDYLVERTNHSFCRKSYDSLRSRNDNWRQIFNNENKRIFLKNLLDHLLQLPHVELQDGLKTIIKSHKFTINDWEYYFINNPRAIQECKYNEIRWFNKDDIRILHSSTITGYHLELRTIWLYQYLLDISFDIKPFEKKMYLFDKNTGGFPGIKLSSYQVKEKAYDLDIRFSKEDNEYEFCFYHKADTINERSADAEVVNKMDDFIYDDNLKHYFKKVKKESIIDALTQLIEKL